MDERLEALTRLVDGWFWETDENHCFTYMSDSVETVIGVPAAWHYGKSRIDVRVVDSIGDTIWDEHVACLEAHEPFTDFQYKRRGPDGERWLSVSGEPFFDPGGAFRGYRGFARDITSKAFLANYGDWIASIFDQIDEAIALWGTDGKLIIFNRAFRKLYPGMEALLLPGLEYEAYARHVVEKGLVHVAVEDQEDWIARWAERQEGGGRLMEVEGRDGQCFLIDEKRLDNGLRATVISNITDLRRARSNSELVEQRLEDFALSATDFFWETDAEHRFSYMGDRVEEIVGVKVHELIGKTRVEFHEADGVASDLWDRHRNDLANYRPFRDLRAQRIHKDGSEVWVSISGRPVFGADGAFIGYRGTTTDITRTIEAEREAENAKQKADEANKAKSDFLSSVSHELRTPLNAILGFSQLLEMDDERSLSRDQRDSVDQIQKSGKHLLELINEVLDLTSIESGKISLSMEEIELELLLSECFAAMMPAARQAGIDLRADLGSRGSVTILADRTRVRQIVLNLLSNAIKYNSPDGECALKVDIRSKNVKISVADTGFGIPREKQSELFIPFSRAGAENTKIEGTGIGLAITKHLTELLGGNIGFQSEHGVGSTFWVEFPYQFLGENAVDSSIRIEDAVVAEEVSIPLSADFKVLYVEDNPANLLLMERIVAQIPGAGMISATTAERGLQLVEQQRPHVVLMDINLPGMSGLEAMRHLKKNPTTSAVPVIAVSADAMPESIRAGMEEGFKAYISKPVQVAEIIKILHDVRTCGPVDITGLGT